MAQTYLRGQQILQGLDLVPATDTTPLTFRTLSGEVFTLDVAPSPLTPLSTLPDVNAGPYPRYLQGTLQGILQNYSYVYTSATRMLYFKYSACQDMAGNPFATFSQNLLATLDSNPVDTLVFDFRGNT